MFKKFVCLTSFICVCAVFGSAQAQLKIDFGTVTSPLEDGYEAYTATNEVSNTFTAQSFDAFGGTVTVALSWPSNAPAAAKQMWDRSTDGRYAYTGEHEPLIQDWTGTDGREANANPFTLTLSGLPTGIYSWLSYHHDGIDQTGEFSVTVRDASGTATTENVEITNSAGGDNVTDFESVSTFTTQFTSNGTDDVVLEFTITSSTSNLATAFFVMNGFEIDLLTDLNIAHGPSPADKDTDVLRDTVLSWIPGKYAETHNLFLGTDFNDVNDATAASPLSADFIEGLDANTYEPGRLEFGTTYYWRVDEVNAPSTPGAWRGEVWRFEVEPVAYKVPASDIKASASGSYGNYDPNDT
ncbi:MAG: hypothetical protein P8016_09535, partial [Sedimentisphaerales bacterium]